MTIPQPGIYQHFKGNKYELLAVARHSETLELMAVYRPLYCESGVWVRPLKMWSEKVEHEGKLISRFELVEAAEPSEDSD